MLSVSIVVPIKNAERTLPVCLQALGRLNPAPMEILLIDNGSRDGSLALQEAFAKATRVSEVRALREPRPGAGTARNAGIRAARGDVIVMTDADCEPEAGWLSHLLEPLGDPQVGAVAGRVVAAPAASTVELFSALYTLRSSDQPARYDHWTPWEGGFPTANFAIRRDLAKKLRGFDEAVTIYGEDYDLCARLYKLGAVIAYVPAARVAHHHRTTLHGLLRQAFGFGRSHPYLLRRHAPGGLWIELPRRSFVVPRCPLPVWLDLASADKKVLAVMVLGAWYGPALWLLAPLAFWLVMNTYQRARQDGTPVGGMSAIGLAGLLLLKSSAMTAGRWWGSVKYKALCL